MHVVPNAAHIRKIICISITPHAYAAKQGIPGSGTITRVKHLDITNVPMPQGCVMLTYPLVSICEDTS